MKDNEILTIPDNVDALEWLTSMALSICFSEGKILRVNKERFSEEYVNILSSYGFKVSAMTGQVSGWFIENDYSFFGLYNSNKYNNNYYIYNTNTNLFFELAYYEIEYPN